MKEKIIELVPLVDLDISELTQIMKRAFDKDSREFLGEMTGGPPGYDNGDFLRKYGLMVSTSAFKVTLDGKAVGGVILWINDNGENFLGNLFIDSELQDRGIGQSVWNMVEKKYPETKVWRTETPIFSRRNHNFYVNKCGFHIVSIENPKDMHEGEYKMEKQMR